MTEVNQDVATEMPQIVIFARPPILLQMLKNMFCQEERFGKIMFVDDLAHLKLASNYRIFLVDAPAKNGIEPLEEHQQLIKKAQEAGAFAQPICPKPFDLGAQFNFITDCIRFQLNIIYEATRPV